MLYSEELRQIEKRLTKQVNLDAAKAEKKKRKWVNLGKIAMIGAMVAHRRSNWFSTRDEVSFNRKDADGIDGE